MKKKKMYSMGAKIAVIAVLILAAAAAGLSGSWLLVGMGPGRMTLREVIRPVAYEESREAAYYLNREGDTILSTLKSRSGLYENGITYNENATIDLSDVESGIRKADKTPELTYRLGNLRNFYETAGYRRLEWLLDHYYDLSEGAYNPSEEVLEGDVGYEPLFPEAGETAEETLCRNGLAIEKEFLPTEAGTTIADYVRAYQNGREAPLVQYYTNLLDVAEKLATLEAVDMEETNARFYLKNVKTGSVYTNVSGWGDLTLKQIFTDYQENDTDPARTPAYILLDETGTEYEAGYQSGSERNLGAMSDMAMSLLASEDTFEQAGAWQMFMGLDTRYPVRNSVSYQNRLFYDQYLAMGRKIPVNAFALLCVSLGVMTVMLILAAIQSGHRPEDAQIHPAPIDRCPIEILLVIDVVCWRVLMVGASVLVSDSFYSYGHNGYMSTVAPFVSFDRAVPSTAALTAIGICMALLLAWDIKHYGRRIKAGKLGGSIIRCVCRAITRGVRKAFLVLYESRRENQKLVIAYLTFVLGHVILLAIAGCMIGRYYGGVGALIILLVLVFDICVLVRLAGTIRGRDEIKKGMAAIAGGDLDYQVDLEQMAGENRKMAQELNRVRDGLRQAVESEMKSERLKTDLITNVSHDIKTPLTSIINYVDILKRENIQDEKIVGYIDILDRKSMRLKQLTEDLVEASKISSGNITLEMQDINLKQLIKQTNGEFGEKFAAKNLELICSLPESEMVIRADGRRMFRVIENLYNNVAKYAMPHSRVYVTGELKGGRIIFSVKNMSEHALNFEAEELLERFVRGDVSRSTEGSGLGLEIARNLTVMQKGSFDLYLDGDLFKVTITFDAV